MPAMGATASSRRQTGKMRKLPNGEAAGADDAVPEIVWPPRVVQPTPPPALVYLDLNHYINLARTAAGLETPDGCDGLLRAATAARQQDRAVFPLSGTHYVEMSGILDPAQRTAVAEMMESLSGFRMLIRSFSTASSRVILPGLPVAYPNRTYHALPGLMLRVLAFLPFPCDPGCRPFAISGPHHLSVTET